MMLCRNRHSVIDRELKPHEDVDTVRVQDIGKVRVQDIGNTFQGSEEASHPTFCGGKFF